MSYYVYKVVNKNNGKWYIGKRKHKNPTADSYMGSGKLIKEAIEKHGKDSFKKEIIEVFQTNAEAAALEEKLVTKDSINTNMSYNMHEGGHGGWAYINNGSEEHIERCKRAAAKSSGKDHPNWGKEKFKPGEKRAIEWSKKANEYRKKHGLSEEHKEKIRLGALKRYQKNSV
jgi:hypothetical protein